MTKYIKNIDGKDVVKTRQQIVVTVDGMDTYNPSEAMIFADGWTEYVYVAPEKTLMDYKRELLEAIKNYDTSSEINEFFIQGMPVWYEKDIRVGLNMRFESEISRGKENTILWYGNACFPLKLEDAVNMLYAVEDYASMCYDNTHRHLVAVEALETIDDVLSYDYKSGYPDKLHFDI